MVLYECTTYRHASDPGAPLWGVVVVAAGFVYDPETPTFQH